MAAITAALIKQVREDTGAGMMDVKKALTEAEGDVARAKEIIRAKGIQAAGKREGRKAQEGTIASKVIESAEGQTGYAVELNSETDFVAKTPKFVEFADTVLGYAVAADANNADELLASNAEDGTVKVAVEEAAALFGEHVKVGQFAKISGPHVEIYAHKKSVEMPPSIVAMIATDEAGAKVAHEAALQISAMAPSGSAVRTFRPMSSSPSVASPPRSPWPKASPRRSFRRSSKAVSTPSTRKSSCLSSRSSRIRPRPSASCSRKSAARPWPSPVSRSARAKRSESNREGLIRPAPVRIIGPGSSL